MSELLAILTSHAKWPDGSAPGGHVTITQQDVAAACKGMNRHAYLYALAKFTLDRNVLPELRVRNQEMTVHRAGLEGWRCRDPEAVLRFADIALAEALDPRMCRSCRGAGVSQDQRECRSCKGLGYAAGVDTHCAKAMGIERQSWAQTWRPRLASVLSDLAALEDDIARHLYRRLSGS